jgi:hypothetical protein
MKSTTRHATVQLPPAFWVSCRRMPICLPTPRPCWVQYTSGGWTATTHG